jgi:hypothetical protein
MLVTVNPSPAISITASNPNLCSGGFTFLNASGAASYVWSTGETGSQIGVSPTQTTTYSVTGTNASGCSGSSSYTVNVGGPTVTVTATNPEMCTGGFTFLNASGATSYLWSTGETGAQIGASPTQTTTYQVTGTDDIGCSSTASITVTVVGPNVTVSATDSDLCPGEFTFITASGATEYVWSTGETGPQIGTTPPATITYTVTGTDGSDCSSTASITINVDPSNCTSGRGRDTQVKETPHPDARNVSLNEFSIYPNPTKGVFSISGSPNDATMEVFNSRGERVILRSMSDGKEIDLTPYSKGLYFIKVKHNGSAIYSTRVYKE